MRHELLMTRIQTRGKRIGIEKQAARSTRRWIVSYLVCRRSLYVGHLSDPLRRNENFNWKLSTSRAKLKPISGWHATGIFIYPGLYISCVCITRKVEEAEREREGEKMRDRTARQTRDDKFRSGGMSRRSVEVAGLIRDAQLIPCVEN